MRPLVKSILFVLFLYPIHLIRSSIHASKMSSIPVYYSAEEVKAVLTWPIINEAVEEALRAVSQRSNEDSICDPAVCQPARSFTMAGNKSRILLTMPGYLSSNNGSANQQKALGCKLVTSFSENMNRSPPMPSILANILLFDTDTGRLRCIMEGTQITDWRTAAASIVATKYLYFKRFNEDALNKSVKVAIIGCGAQGRAHALGMCATFSVSHLYLWNRTPSKADALAKLMRDQANETQVEVMGTPAEAVAQADIICIATRSPQALINRAMFTKSSVHINAVGAGEVHYGEVGQDIYDVADTYVDSMVSAKTELIGLNAKIVGEVGEAMLSERYPNKEGITVFQSMGMAIEDVAVAHSIYQLLTR